MDSSVRVILNGKSAVSVEFREAVFSLRKQKIAIDVRVTQEQGDAARFVQEACQEGIAKLIAAGGDGTIHEIVNSLMTCKSGLPALGIVPMGTANDFAVSCNLPVAINEALHFGATGKAVPVDVIQINEFYFLNVATSGFGAEVTSATPPELKRILGGAAYSLMGVIMALNLKTHDGELVLPGSVTRKGVQTHFVAH